MVLGQVWAAAAVLVQLLWWLVWAGCVVAFGCVAADVGSVDAAVALAGVHQPVLKLDVCQNAPGHLNVVARYDSDGTAAVV